MSVLKNDPKLKKILEDLGNIPVHHLRVAYGKSCAAALDRIRAAEVSLRDASAILWELQDHEEFRRALNEISAQIGKLFEELGVAENKRSQE